MASENLAQIVPDNSLSDESSLIIENSTINQNQIVDLIEGGATRDQTLFHSFQEFNVLSNQQVYFANPGGIEQIVTRVTGSNSSNILGKLGVNGSANLFLLNPNGFLLGENASLDLQGSFLATTAESVLFDNDLVYSASNPKTPLLNIGIPQGIQMGANVGKIEVRGTGHQLSFDSSTLMPTGELNPSRLEVSQGNTLALIAGELNLNGGNLTASEGNIELAAIAQSGEIQLKQKANILKFDYDQIDNFGNINLFKQSSLDVRGGKNLGSVKLRGHDITLENGSTIIASKLRPGNSKTEGEINLTATNSLNIVNNASGTFPSSVFTLIEQNSNKPGINIDIKTDSLRLENNALIVSTVTNKGIGGNVNIDARSVNLIDNYDLPYNAGIYSQTLSGAKGEVGIITVEVDNLQLLDGQTVIYINDEDDLEDIIGEDRAEDLEDLIEDREDWNIVIGRLHQGKRTLVFKGGGQITSSNGGNGDTGIGIVVAKAIQLSNNSEIDEPDVPDVEPPDVVVEEPDVPDVEPPDVVVEEPDVPDVEPPDVVVDEPDVPEVEPPDVVVDEPDVPEVEPPDVVVDEPDVPDVEPPDVVVEEPDVPDVEPPDVVVDEPDVPEVEPPGESVPTKNLSDNKVFTFDLGNGETFVIKAEELFRISQLESVANFVNSSNTRKRKPIEIHASNVSTTATDNLSFDLSSACRAEGSHFVIVGKGGIAENPLQSVIQDTTVPDLESTLFQLAESISSTKSNHAPSQIEPIVEASAWQVNKKGQVELLAALQPKRSTSITKLPDCLPNSRNNNPPN